jgi:hypothetical protein
MGWRFHEHGFVAVERHGRWVKAIEVPGLAALNKGRFAGVNSVSCASAGNCAAGGDYSEPHGQGFVVSERNGVWGSTPRTGSRRSTADTDMTTPASIDSHQAVTSLEGSRHADGRGCMEIKPLKVLRQPDERTLRFGQFLADPAGPVISVAFSPHGRMSLDGKVRLWNVANPAHP